jgi:hypothetical protein
MRSTLFFFFSFFSSFVVEVVRAVAVDFEIALVAAVVVVDRVSPATSPSTSYCGST